MATARFEWDAAKNRENRGKHGVDLATAQFAFADPRRVIAEDTTHSADERRFFCFGQSGVVYSPSDSLIGPVSSASLAPVIGERANLSMSARIKYPDEPLGKLKVVPNFLPAPKDLVYREEGVKVTLALSKRSVEFFKHEAAKHNTQYQRMIRRLLDVYAERHAQPIPKGSIGGVRAELRPRSDRRTT